MGGGIRAKYFCQYKRELSIQVPGVGFLMTDLIWFSGKLEKTQVTAFYRPCLIPR